MKAPLWNQGCKAWAEHRHRQLLPSITCLLPKPRAPEPSQPLNRSLVAPSACRQPSPKRGSLGRVGLFSQQIPVQKSREGHLRGHLHPRGGTDSTSHVQEPALRVSTSPCSTESKDKQHHKQRLTFLLDSFPPPPKKAIWCFVYRESCHGEPACKSASTIVCIRLANSWPKEPKNPGRQKI